MNDMTAEELTREADRQEAELKQKEAKAKLLETVRVWMVKNYDRFEAQGLPSEVAATLALGVVVFGGLRSVASEAEETRRTLDRIGQSRAHRRGA
jgi:hypothetical protein